MDQFEKPAKSQTTVLIIDDEKEICFLLAAIIRKKNMHPIYVHSLGDARKIIKTMLPEWVFLDISLPDGSGLDLLKELNIKYPDLKIVIISAFDSYREKALKAGAYSFLIKPFNRESMINILADASI
jgi:DNA-binding NtrC family response regulator